MSAPTYDWCGHQPASVDGTPARPCGAPIERWSYEWRHRDTSLDADHKPVVAPPIGPVDEGLHMRASRYAEALTAAAAADERIGALTELLAQHEFYRSQAESALYAVQVDPQFGTVWQTTGPEPDVSALLCLVSGVVYIRRTHGVGWQRAEHNPTTATVYEWPISDAGPFIGWADDYGFDTVLRQARKDQQQFDALHRRLHNIPGYHADAARWGRPSLVEAIDRILAAKDHARYAATERAVAAEQALAQLRRTLSLLDADDVQQWPRDVLGGEDGDERLVEVGVVNLDTILAILERRDCGGTGGNDA